MPGGNVIVAFAEDQTAVADEPSTGWRRHPAAACLVEAGICSSAATQIVRAIMEAINRSDEKGEIALVPLSRDLKNRLKVFMAASGASNFRAVLDTVASRDFGAAARLTLGDDHDGTWFVMVEEPMLLD